MRPGTSEKTKSAIASFVRRSRWARACSSASATSGRPVSQGRRAEWPTAISVASVSAVAVAVRGPGSNSDNSPSSSPGPRIASRLSRPSEAVCPSLTLPSVMTNIRSPGSPSRKRSCPFDNRTSTVEALQGGGSLVVEGCEQGGLA